MNILRSLQATFTVAALTLIMDCGAQAQTEPGGISLVEGPNDGPQLGINGTFRNYEFSPRYNELQVDPRTGLAGGSRTFVSIGTDTGGLAYTRDLSDEFGRYDNFTGLVDDRGATIVVTALGQTERLTEKGLGDFSSL